MTAVPRPAPKVRVLAAVLVYNGRDFVPACLESSARLRSAATHEVDVLVLDDCSPDPGWSDGLALQCIELGIDCYRSPRNLGIPRNMNLAALWTLARSYDYLLLLNSDTVLPANLADVLVEVASSQRSVGSVTAWSNSASLYSLPNDGGDPSLSDGATVDWISARLYDEFAASGLEVPTGVGFCMLIPADALRRVGLLDPVYGRGYCEEVDWNLRARALGYRSLLAPGTFVYHRGQGSTVDAGLVGLHQTSVAHHERIIDFRHPEYRSQLVEFVCSGVLPPLQDRAALAIVRAAAAVSGYTVQATALPRPARPGTVRFVADAGAGTMAFTGQFAGFTARIPVAAEAPLATLAAVLGRLPDRVAAFERGIHTDHLAAESASAGIAFDDLTSYPERV
jgi:GT2 family glycosyltransferase